MLARHSSLCYRQLGRKLRQFVAESFPQGSVTTRAEDEPRLRAYYESYSRLAADTHRLNFPRLYGQDGTATGLKRSDLEGAAASKTQLFDLLSKKPAAAEVIPQDEGDAGKKRRTKKVYEERRTVFGKLKNSLWLFSKGSQ